MGFRQITPDPEELLYTVRTAQELLDELIARIKEILQLMEQLHMEDMPAYREYQEALRTLAQLQHTNEETRSRAVCYQTACQSFLDDLQTAISHPKEKPPEEKTPPEVSAPDTKDTKNSDVPPVPDTAPSPLEERRSCSKAPVEASPKPFPRGNFSLFGRRKHLLSCERRHNAARSRSFMRNYHPMLAAPGAPAGGAPLPQTGRPSLPSSLVPPVNKVQFSAVVPLTLMRGEYAVLSLFMYEKEFHQAVEELMQQNPGLLKENRSGVLQVQQGAAVRIELDSPDLKLTDNTQTQTWLGEYLRFDFALLLPENYPKRQVLFSAKVFINDLIATRLTFLVDCSTPNIQVIDPLRQDVLSAFMSYAKEDRPQAAAILLGMQKARPDLNVFFDVESLRSGENWQAALPLEIARRDIFFLCWSHYAKESAWVHQEWNCALAVKGLSCIEPIPLESPDRCPPPPELDGKQFNDRLLYIIHADQNRP